MAENTKPEVKGEAVNVEAPAAVKEVKTEKVEAKAEIAKSGSAAEAQAKNNGAAPTRKFGTGTSFSSDNFSRDNRGPRRDDRGGNTRDGGKGRGRGDRRNNRREDDKDKAFEEQTIAIDRVSRTVKGGRRLRFKALVVVGDRKTKVGVGVAKGADVQAAIEKATDVAKKNLITIPLNKTTIPHEVEVRFGGAHVLLKPAAPGTGIIAGGVLRTIIGTTEISNLLTKSLGSKNKVNIAYATIKALTSLVPQSEWVGNDKPAKKVAKEAK
jgi:small subunit ribosomal protein S5